MAEETPRSALLGKIAAYTEILQKDPGSTIFVSLSEAYRKMGHLDDARQIVETGLDLHPDFSPGYIVLARILCQQSAYEASRSAFLKALQLDGNSLAGLVGFARLCVLTGEIGQARELLLQARGLSPADPVINKFLNSLPVAAKEPETAAPAPQVVSAPLITATLADLYLKQGLPDKALEILRELLRNDPDNLELRRRIRDAELMLPGACGPVEVAAPRQDLPVDDAQGSPSVAGPAVADVAPQPVVEEPEVAAEPFFDSREEETARREGSGSAAEADSSPLGVLNLWLENIRKRRSNV